MNLTRPFPPHIVNSIFNCARRSRFLQRPIAIVCLMFAFGSCSAAENEAIDFFETKIRPVLIEHCYSCHSAEAKSVKGGLLLDTKQGVLAGGESGAAVIPKNSAESLLLSAIRYEDYEMPPKGQLPDAVIADFETWILMGAHDPRESTTLPASTREIDIDAGRDFWSFVTVSDPVTPENADSDWPSTEIDDFILEKLNQAGLVPIEDATAAAWLRRVKFDIVGLPPTEQEREKFLSDAIENMEEAKAAVVDRLLQSRHFGERWARHWLDVARYAESTGRTRNYPFPFAWRYRDYVIRSFNEDKPYDQFVIEQLAGDLLQSDDREERENQLVATGFLAVGSPDLNERNAEVFRMDMVADQIDTISRSMLGLTVGCARCHDHKFDPIPTSDYYAMAGIFKSTQLLNGYSPKGGGGNKARGDLLIKLGENTARESVAPPSEEEQLTAGLDKKKAGRLVRLKEERDAASAKVNSIKKNKELARKQRSRQLAQAKRELSQKTKQFNQLRNKFSRDRNVKIEGPACLGVREAKKIADCKIHIRGDTQRLGDEVPRGPLQVVTSSDDSFSIPDDASGRLQLAHWIATPENPLTARVYVNRVWQQLFGRGIVSTVDNFGMMGSRPTHPELLDFLAQQFASTGWSTKQLIRQIVLSRVYGLSSRYDARNAAVDEENTLLWRTNARRLDYEALRDALLMVSKRLDLSVPTGSHVESLKINEISKQKTEFDYDSFTHRSVYLPLMRNLLPDEMSYFDFPDRSETRGKRDSTTVPTQSLYLLNSRFVIDLADSLGSALQQADASPGDKHLSEREIAARAHRQLLSREATEEELATIIEYVQRRQNELRQAEKQPAKQAKGRKQTRKSARDVAWSEVVHAMFASAEFRYR